MPSKPIQTLIADVQYLVTESLAQLIYQNPEYQLTGLTDSLSGIIDHLEQNTDIQLLVTDYFLVDYQGFDDLAKIMSKYKVLKVLILTNSIKPADVNEFRKLGIINIVLKTSGRDEILHAMRYTLQGKKYYSDEILDMLIGSNSARDEVIVATALTPAEIEITRLIVSGLTTKEIALRNHKSFHTVMSHRKNIFRKLNINSTSGLVRYAIKAGLIDNIEYYI